MTGRFHLLLTATTLCVFSGLLFSEPMGELDLVYEGTLRGAPETTVPDTPGTILDSTSQATRNRPNIVFILADDLGFSDLASYGSEIKTPKLDQLAASGVRFSNFHTAANCAPSRAMMLTGVSNHLAGVPTIPEMVPAAHRATNEHLGTLSDRVVTIASLLEQSGYHTYLSGKWHLGSAPHQRPYSRGFEQTLALMESGADNWEHKTYIPIYEDATWTENGELIRRPSGVYSSSYLVDRMISFIDSELDDSAPFFAYLPFQAVHIPVQAPEEYTAPYEKTYLTGWHEIRAARHESAVDLGIVPLGAARREMNSTDVWDALTPAEQQYEAKRMAVYAGMVSAMDAEIGRLRDFLAERGELANTLFIFTSDNGAEASGAPKQDTAGNRWSLSRLGYSINESTLGTQGSFNTISPSFASAAASPLAEYKFHAGEGGMRVPLIISGPMVQAKGEITNAFAWATDIAATILSAAGVSPPSERFAGRPILPITGKSLLPLLADPEAKVYEEDEFVGYELAGNRALFKGDFKLHQSQPPLGDGHWRLYNIATDPGETIDLTGLEPERFRTMLAEYERFTAQSNVLPLPEGYSRTRTLIGYGIKTRFGDTILAIVLTASLLALMVFITRLARASRP